MLTEVQMERYSDVLLWALKTARSGNFKKNDIILIRYERGSIELSEIMHARFLEMGMNPVLRMGLTSRMERNFFERANNNQLVFQAPSEKELYKSINGSIFLHAPESLTHLSHIDPKRIGKAILARKPLRDILEKREAEGTFGWTLCMLPTSELAKHAGLSMKRYSDQIIRACYLDKDDPVGEWEKIYKDAAAIKKRMNSLDVEYFHIQSENINLIIKPGKKRKWIGISGHNIPSFEIFLSPDWRGTEGVYFANQPSFRSGNYVENVRIEFRRGVAFKVEAAKGKDFISKQLSIDIGASRVGEFSLTDKRFSKINKFMASTLYDENYGGNFGNCHLALGSSYLDTYDGDASMLKKDGKDKLGFNDSALHWDLVNTEKKTVTASLTSGEKRVIYEDGIFKC
ncbi:MAG: aminopeptidase [Spirochaetota bacterium]|nr:aminopeptidase [Spirochaetota bacterium]